MEELFKKFVYTGVGFVAYTADKIQETVNELVNQDKITEEEGKKIVDDFLSNTESKKEDFEAKLKGLADEVVGKFNFANATKKDGFSDLRARIERLEAKLGINIEAEEEVVTSSNAIEIEIED